MRRVTTLTAKTTKSLLYLVGALLVTPPVSAQEDPDVSPVWAAFHGVDLDTINLDADQDGDGLSARAEAVFGTDPFDRESAVGLRITTGPVLRVTWDTVPGARYQPESSTDLNAWSLAGLAIDGDGGSASIDVVPDVFGAFVRVRGLAPPDSDGDELDDLEEAMLGTNPLLADTDGDGESDFREVFELGTDPLTANSWAFVLIPAGSFRMGDTFGTNFEDERPVHTVNVPAFFLQARETTKEEWDEVRAWALENGYDFHNPGGGKAAGHPVHTVNWYDVVKWCNARSEKEGLTPCYYLEEAHATVYRTGQVDLTNTMVDWEASGYRLPTEAEWEKAARGGLQGRRFPWGDTITHARANYNSHAGFAYDTSPTRGYHPDWDDGTLPYTSPVGSFPPNGYGLFDMSGNVWEWCWDWWQGDYYANSPVTAPLGPDLGLNRVLRGGSWLNRAIEGRLAHRHANDPSSDWHASGFRPARGQ